MEATKQALKLAVRIYAQNRIKAQRAAESLEQVRRTSPGSDLERDAVTIFNMAYEAADEAYGAVEQAAQMADRDGWSSPDRVLFAEEAEGQVMAEDAATRAGLARSGGGAQGGGRRRKSKTRAARKRSSRRKSATRKNKYKRRA